MGRRKGKPMYGAGKPKVQGSYYISKLAYLKLAAAAKRTGKSESNVIDHCLREAADALTRAIAEGIAEQATA